MLRTTSASRAAALAASAGGLHLQEAEFTCRGFSKKIETQTDMFSYAENKQKEQHQINKKTKIL